jgi:hypothetical protein
MRMFFTHARDYIPVQPIRSSLGNIGPADALNQFSMHSFGRSMRKNGLANGI